MNISIFASIGCQNLGDELILKNEIELLKREFGKDSRFRVASYDPKNPAFDLQKTLYFEYFPIGIKNPRNIFRNIRNYFKFFSTIWWSDIVVIGGGGIIYDSEIQSVRNPLDQWIFRSKVARFFRKNIYFYAIGIDIKNPENLKKLENICRCAYKVTVRDIKSWEQLKKVGIESDIVDDPVMSEHDGSGRILGVHSSKKFRLDEFHNYSFEGKTVGLALRKGYIGSSGKAQIEKLLIAELCSYIESRGGSIIFLPHSFHRVDSSVNDYEFLTEFLTRERNICANMQEVYTAYNHKICDIVISQRLHSIILSYVYGINQIALSYSTKTDEVLKKLSK